MSTVEKKGKVSIEEYLAYDDSIPGKAEYFDGVVVDWEGGSLEHAAIGPSLNVAIHKGLKDSRSRIYGNRLKLSIPSCNAIVYPDLFVIADPTEISPIRPHIRDIVCNPILIVEILATETAYLDLFVKLRCYMQISTLREYMVVDQYRPAVSIFRFGENGEWKVTNESNWDNEIHLQSVDARFQLSEIYSQIDFETENNSSQKTNNNSI